MCMCAASCSAMKRQHAVTGQRSVSHMQSHGRTHTHTHTRIQTQRRTCKSTQALHTHTPAVSLIDRLQERNIYTHTHSLSVNTSLRLVGGKHSPASDFSLDHVQGSGRNVLIASAFVHTHTHTTWHCLPVWQTTHSLFYWWLFVYVQIYSANCKIQFRSFLQHKRGVNEKGLVVFLMKPTLCVWKARERERECVCVCVWGIKACCRHSSMRLSCDFVWVCQCLLYILSLALSANTHTHTHTHTRTQTVIHRGTSLINNLLSGERKADRQRTREKKETDENGENVSVHVYNVDSHQSYMKHKVWQAFFS